MYILIPTSQVIPPFHLPLSNHLKYIQICASCKYTFNKFNELLDGISYLLPKVCISQTQWFKYYPVRGPALGSNLHCWLLLYIFFLSFYRQVWWIKSVNKGWTNIVPCKVLEPTAVLDRRNCVLNKSEYVGWWWSVCLITSLNVPRG